MLRFVTWIVVSVIGVTAPAQALEHDGQAWLQFYWQGPTEPGIRGYMEVQSRFGQDFSRLELALIRPGVAYVFNERHSLWGGYAWAPAFTGKVSHESRLWQQHLYRLALGGTLLSSRLRFEQRSFGSFEGLSHRLREQVRVQFPLATRAKLSGVVWDELFWNLNAADGRVPSGYNQNRFFAGLGYPIQDLLWLEVGYLNAHVRRPGAPENLMLHTAVIALFASF